MFFALAIFVAICFGLYLYLTWNFDYWTKRQVLGPKPIPFLGNLKNEILRNRNVLYDIQDIYDEFKGKTPFVGILRMRSPTLILLSPELAKDVCIRNFKNFHDNGFGRVLDKEIDPLFGRNPFLLEGDAWKVKRSEITPAFTPSRIKALFPLIEDVTKKFTKYIRTELDKNTKEPFDAREICAKYTTDSVASCIFAIDAESFTKENPEIRNAGRRLMEPPTHITILLTMISFFPFLKLFLKVPFVPKDLENFFLSLMEQAIKYRDESTITRDDYLDYLISLKKKKEIETLDMAAHGVTFFMDGFDTSSLAIAHTLYELGVNPDVQDKLRQEIIEVLGNNKQLNFDKLNADMPYLDQVCNEALRMHSPELFTSRICTEPIEIEGVKGKKLLVEKDVSIIIPVMAIHNDPENYDEPEKFKPERFSQENGGIRSYVDKGIFLPFGMGPRVCLGMRFALVQSKAAIVFIVRNFQISGSNKNKLPFTVDATEFINAKTGGLWINFKSLSE